MRHVQSCDLLFYFIKILISFNMHFTKVIIEGILLNIDILRLECDLEISIQMLLLLLILIANQLRVVIPMIYLN